MSIVTAIITFSLQAVLAKSETKGHYRMYTLCFGALGMGSVEREIYMQTSADSKGSKRRGSDDNRLKLQWSISDELIMLWISRADLARITGQGGIYLPVLDHVGIATVPQLAQSEPSTLVAAMQNFRPGPRMVYNLPDEAQVANWIRQAKIMVSREY